MLRLGATLMLAAIGLPAAARADLVSRDAALFFSSATTLEVLRVDRVQGHQPQVTVLRVLRGTSAKKVRKLHAIAAFTPRAGEQLLHACGKLFCVWGREVGDYFALYPGSRHLQVEVRPGMVEKRSLDSLAQGKPAPKICLAVTLRFVDEPQATDRMRAAADAGDGQGRIAGSGKRLRRASLHLQEGRTMLTVGKVADRQVVLTGPLPGRLDAGCHQVELRPTWPLARTGRSLQRALGGRLSKVVLAQGAIHIRRRGTPLGRGLYPLTVEHDPRRGRRFSCSLFRDPAPYQGYSRLSSKMLSFPVAGLRDRYVGLVGGFPRGDDLLRFAEAVGPGTSVTWPVRLHGINDEGVVVGEVKLTHVPDPD